MKLTKTIFGLLIIGAILPSIAFGAIVRNGSEIKLSPSDSFTENTYLIATKNDISGKFTEDIFLTGFENYFNGTARGDLFVLGGKNIIAGEVQGDLRIIGGEVELSGKITGDLLVFGGSVMINDSAIIDGQSIFVGGKIIQNAPLKKLTKIISANVVLNASIDTPIEVTAQKIVAENNARINQTIIYYSPTQIEKNGGAQISGQVVYNQIKALEDTDFIKKALINIFNFWILLKFVTTLVLASILIFVFRFFSSKVVSLSIDSFWKSLFVGFLSVLAFMFIVPILLVSLIGMPIGFLSIAVFIVLMALSTAMAGVVVGALIFKLFSKNPKESPYKLTFNSAVVGIVLLTFISFVPYVGDLTKIVFDLIALGAILRQIRSNVFKK